MCAVEREPNPTRPTRLDLTLPGHAVQVNSAATLLGWWWKGLPSTPVPDYSINLHEVADENYEVLVNDIQTQQVGMTMFLDRRFRNVFHFSVQSSHTSTAPTVTPLTFESSGSTDSTEIPRR